MSTPPMATEARLAGKRAVVTGGARGIGAAISRRLASEGAQVAIIDLLTDLGGSLAAEIGGTFHRADLSDADDTRDAMSAAIDGGGGIDVLVNNAGILRFASLLEISTEDWDLMFAINARPMLLTTQVAAHAMIDSGAGGTIVNLASMAGKTGGAGQAHYAASKAAVIALTRVTALELGCHGITANCLCPGYVLTEMGADGRTQEDIALWSSYSPLGRLAEPDDVSSLVAFLASPDASYLTGQAFNVTGGMVMH